jgi:hypothetical protein
MNKIKNLILGKKPVINPIFEYLLDNYNNNKVFIDDIINPNINEMICEKYANINFVSNINFVGNINFISNINFIGNINFISNINFIGIHHIISPDNTVSLSILKKFIENKNFLPIHFIELLINKYNMINNLDFWKIISDWNDITSDFVKKYSDKPFDWYKLINYVDLIDVLDLLIEKKKYNLILNKLKIVSVLNGNIKKQVIKYLNFSKYELYMFIINNQNLINWSLLSRNTRIELDFIEATPYLNWDYYWMSERNDLTWEIIEKNGNWNWRNLTFHGCITPNIINKHPEIGWCYEKIFLNPNITLNDVKTNFSKYKNIYNVLKKYKSLSPFTFECVKIKNLCNNKLSYDPYFTSSTIKNKLFDKYHQELIQKSCHPNRMFNWNDEVKYDYPDEYNLECKKYLEM